jgi:hypothetical protein
MTGGAIVNRLAILDSESTILNRGEPPDGTVGRFVAFVSSLTRWAARLIDRIKYFARTRERACNFGFGFTSFPLTRRHV